MKLDLSTIMFILFILLLTASIWKIWAFLPNKQLPDDDTTQEAEKKLLDLMLKVISDTKGELSHQELFERMKKEETFDTKLFWRFNLNRLNHLLNSYYAQHSKASTTQEIFNFYQSRLNL